MGAVQKLATVVIIGLVALATVLVVYLADEPNRREAIAIGRRGIDLRTAQGMFAAGGRRIDFVELGAVADEAATVALGAALAQTVDALPDGLIVYLQGDLGAGKTTLCRGLLQALGHAGAVKSPTYTLVETYTLRGLVLHHFDLYRLHDAEELEFMGIRDYFGPRTVALVEWPQRGGGHFPPADLLIELRDEGSGRSATITSRSTVGLALAERLKSVLKC